MTIYELLQQLNNEVRGEINLHTVGDPLTFAAIAGKQQLLQRAFELWSNDDTETIDIGDSEHSIIEPVPTERTIPSNEEPI